MLGQWFNICTIVSLCLNTKLKSEFINSYKFVKETPDIIYGAKHAQVACVECCVIQVTNVSPAFYKLLKQAT